MTLASAAGAGNTEALATLLRKFPDRATFNSGRRSVQLAGCLPGTQVGNIPLEERVIAQLDLGDASQLAQR